MWVTYIFHYIFPVYELSSSKILKEYTISDNGNFNLAIKVVLMLPDLLNQNYSLNSWIYFEYSKYSLNSSFIGLSHFHLLYWLPITNTLFLNLQSCIFPPFLHSHSCAIHSEDEWICYKHLCFPFIQLNRILALFFPPILSLIMVCPLSFACRNNLPTFNQCAKSL